MEEATIMLNVLTESVDPYCHSNAEQCCPVSLPEVYAALMADEVEAFPSRCGPHQRHAWHAFLVQLGVDGDAPGRSLSELTMAAASENGAELIRETSRRNILTMSRGSWWLTTSPNRPSCSRRHRRGTDWQISRIVVATPDELDMLVTSKNHDLKANDCTRRGVRDDWIFALV